jgi:putative membrane protein
MLTPDPNTITSTTNSNDTTWVSANIGRGITARTNVLRSILATTLATALLALGSIQLAHAADKPVTDNVFVRDSFSNSQVEIALSQVALEKSANARTKKVAKTIIKDNGSANQKLRELASTRRLEIPTQLDKDQIQQVEQLKNSDRKNIDALYSRHMQQTLVESIQLFDQVAKNPRADAELRVFAAQRLPLFKKQQQMLQKIAGDAPKVAQRQAGL